MLVIAFDPGVSTGVAVVSIQDSKRYTILFADTWGLTDPLDVYMSALRGAYADVPVIAEQAPTQERYFSSAVTQVEKLILDLWPDVEWILPGLWKNSRYGQLLVLSRSRHERDAVRMALWHAGSLRRDENGGDAA